MQCFFLLCLRLLLVFCFVLFRPLLLNRHKKQNLFFSLKNIILMLPSTRTWQTSSILSKVLLSYCCLTNCTSMMYTRSYASNTYQVDRTLPPNDTAFALVQTHHPCHPHLSSAHSSFRPHLLHQTFQNHLSHD